MVGWQTADPPFPRAVPGAPPVAVTTPLAPDRTAPGQPVEPAAASAEVRVLEAVQRGIGRPPVVAAARGMSLFGEHAGGWLALGLVRALADRRRRREWLTAAAGVAAAHGESVAVKRVVRRRRPADPRVRVLVGTPSRLSFPSAHATSTTAAAALYRRLLRRPPAPLLVPRARRTLRPPARPPPRPRARAADGAVAACPGRALPHRRRRGRCTGRLRGGRHPPRRPSVEEVPAMTDIEIPAAPV